MVAGVINKSGAFAGLTSGPTINNQKGMFENAKIRNTIIKPYLRSIGMDPRGQFPLPDIHSLPYLANLKQRVEEIIKEEGYKGGPWMYKGAKITLTWPIWYKAFPKAKWVVVRRRNEEIIDSCRKTGFMNSYSRPRVLKTIGVNTEVEGWQWWIDQHIKRFIEMMEAGIRYYTVWPEKMVDGDYSEMKNVVEGLDLEWNEKQVREFIEPKLWKAKQKRRVV